MFRLNCYEFKKYNTSRTTYEMTTDIETDCFQSPIIKKHSLLNAKVN
jgi:hypothetical protein